MRYRLVAPSILLAAGVAVAGGVVYAESAHHDDERDSEALVDPSTVKVTLVQAVVAAETKTGGRAVRTELEQHRAEAAFEVEIVMPDRSVLNVIVDATDGQVLSGRADQREGRERDDD